MVETKENILKNVITAIKQVRVITSSVLKVSLFVTFPLGCGQADKQNKNNALAEYGKVYFKMNS